jgi:hypothetical protein
MVQKFQAAFALAATHIKHFEPVGMGDPAFHFAVQPSYRRILPDMRKAIFKLMAARQHVVFSMCRELAFHSALKL